MGPRSKPVVESRVMFSLVAEGNDLVLRDGTGKEERRLTVSEATLRRFKLDDVAADLKTTLVYEMKDEQGREDTRT